MSTFLSTAGLSIRIMGNKQTKQRQTASMPVPAGGSAASIPRSPHTPNPTIALPSDFTSFQHARCVAFLKDFQTHRQALSDVSSQLDTLRRELEIAKKTITPIQPSQPTLVTDNSPTPERRISIEGRKSLGKNKKNAGLGGPLTAEVWLAVEADAVFRVNLLTNPSIFPSFPTSNSYDFDTFQLILSTLFREKCSIDIRDQANGLRPRNFPDFLIELLLHSRDKPRNEGFSHIGMLLSSIRRFNSGNKVGVLAGKLFHMSNKDPGSYQLAVCMPKMYDQFRQIAERKYREKVGEKAEFHMEMEDKAKLGDVLNLIYQEFVHDPLSGSHLLLLLKPSSTPSDDFHRFCLIHKLHSSATPLSSLLQSLLTDDSCTVSVESLSRGLKRQLNLWVTEYDLKELIERYDGDGDGEVGVGDLEDIDGKTFPELENMDEFTVTAIDFLTALEEVSRERTYRMVKDLIRIFGGKDVMWTVEETAERLRRVSKDSEEIRGVCEELRKTGEEVSVSEVMSVVARFPIGEWGNSPLVCKDLLRLQDNTPVTDLLHQSGYIIEELGEDE